MSDASGDGADGADGQPAPCARAGRRHGRARTGARRCAASAPGPAVVRSARPGRRHQGRRRPADGARRGRPAGRVRLRRHRPGPARHRRLRQRGEGGRREARSPAASSSFPRGYYLKWTGQYEQLAEMLAPHEDRRAGDAADHRAAAVPAVPELHRGADHPAVDPVRADRQRLAAVAARLPAVDGGLGRHHRAGRPRRADRHRHDRLHRPRLPAPEGGRA